MRREPPYSRALLRLGGVLQGRPSHPEVMMHFPSVLDFPLFQINFSDSVENFPNFFFFWSFTTNLEFPPYFRCFSTFFLSPTFANFSPDFVKCTCFFMFYVFFVTPLVWPWCIYSSHNARTGRLCVGPIFILVLIVNKPFRNLSFRSCAHALLVGSPIPPSCATDWIVKSQHAVVGFWSFFGMHSWYYLLQHNKLALSRN